VPDVRDWLLAFLLTQLVEVPILAAWLRPRPLRERMLLAFGASAITHPILWLVLRPLLAPHSFVAYVVIGELFAVLVEAHYLRRLGVEDALLASVTANGASWITGRVLWAVLPVVLVLGDTGAVASVVERAVSSAHPEVVGIDADALHAALRSGTPPLLVDVRSREEIAVSTIGGAIAAPDRASLDTIPLDRPIVVYCSIGWRSAEAAETLVARGVRDVRNLEGGIFAWVNEGRPVVRDGDRVREVHPFDPRWGLLLDDALEAYVPPPR
jgi:rhodanese-related sulfurtransferase